jgi:Uma2 family endonuclease
VVIFVVFTDVTDVNDKLNRDQDLIEVKPHKTKLASAADTFWRYSLGNTVLKLEQAWTYADYCSWPDDERCELIDGVAYAMSPAPSRQYQELSGELFRQFANHLKGKPCKVYDAPFDLRLSEQNAASDNYVTTVVQPDILVVCDSSKLDDRGCNGAPDLIVEILSPATAARDLKEKFDLY